MAHKLLNLISAINPSERHLNEWRRLTYGQCPPLSMGGMKQEDPFSLYRKPSSLKMTPFIFQVACSQAVEQSTSTDNCRMLSIVKTYHYSECLAVQY